MAVKPIPDGYRTVTPYLAVEGAHRVLDFVKKAFDAEEKVLMPGPGGKVGHAEVLIGDSMVMMGDVSLSPNPRPMPAMIHLYVKDCDATYKRALDAGAASDTEPTNQFYGDRTASVRDAAGNVWYIATHVEEVSPEEMQRRMAEQQG